MPQAKRSEMKKQEDSYTELVGLFQSEEQLEQAMNGLTSAGWHRAALSMLGQRDTIIPEHVDGRPEELADDREAERQDPVSDTDVRQGRAMTAGMAGVAAAFAASGATIMTGGGALAAIVGAAVAGGGAGTLVEALGRKVSKQRKHFLEEQLERGGILLWVKIDTPEGERRAREIFEKCGASNIHLHGNFAEKADEQ